MCHATRFNLPVTLSDAKLGEVSSRGESVGASRENKRQPQYNKGFCIRTKPHGTQLPQDAQTQTLRPIWPTEPMHSATSTALLSCQLLRCSVGTRLVAKRGVRLGGYTKAEEQRYQVQPCLFFMKGQNAKVQHCRLLVIAILCHDNERIYSTLPPLLPDSAPSAFS